MIDDNNYNILYNYPLLNKNRYIVNRKLLRKMWVSINEFYLHLLGAQNLKINFEILQCEDSLIFMRVWKYA